MKQSKKAHTFFAIWEKNHTFVALKMKSTMEKSVLNIYKASAGSGKTFTLTAEYIRLMVQPCAQQEYLSTLAVTFTNKATAEMKDRIITSLYGIGHNCPGSEGMLGAVMKKLEETGTPMGEDAIRERCKEVLSDILHDYTRFRVETIDSFFQSILRNLARELGLSANLQVEISDTEIIENAVDRIIENLKQEKETREHILEYLREKIEEDGKWHITDDIKKFAKSIFDTEFQKKSAEEKALLDNNKTIGLFRKFLREKRQELQENMPCADKMLEILGEPTLANAIGQNGVNLSNAILKDKNGEFVRNKTVEKFEEDPASLLKKAFQGKPELTERLAVVHKMFLEFKKQAEDNIDELNTIAFIQKNLNDLRLLGRISQEIDEINRENDSFVLAKTPLLLSELIKEDDSPFIFEKIGTVLRNVMIDEFQDTSNLQWLIFKTLLFENQSLGGSDLIVGDIKQSIYRWRGGVWDLLHKISTQMSQWSPNEVTLDTNWRSDERVINFNNLIFPRLAAQLDENNGDAALKLSELYKDVRQKVASKHKGAGYVQVAQTEDEEDAMEAMMQEIKNLYSQGLPYEEMAIIVRRNIETTNIIEYAAQYHPEIPIISDEAFLLKSSSGIRILIGAMKLLTEDYERKPLPFREFLMQYYREIAEEDLTLDELMLNPIEELLPPILREKRDELRNLPITELTETLYRELHLSRIQHQDAYFFALMDILREHIKNQSSDVCSFLDKWEEKYHKTAIPSGKIDGIRVLTIHKSKGLEFHTVLIPFCPLSITSSQSQKLWCTTEKKGDTYNQFGALPVMTSSKMEQSFFHDSYLYEMLQQQVDSLNMLYVAFTRASRNLYVWGKMDKSNMFKLIHDALKSEEGFCDDELWTYTSGEPETTLHNSENKHYTRMEPEVRSYDIKMTSKAPRFNFMQSNESEQFTDEGKSKTSLGKLYHYIFSQITDYTLIDKVLRDTREQGLIENDEQMKVVRDYLDEIMKHELTQKWFDPKNEIFNECTIILPTENRAEQRRPDRVVKYENLITVIDYKFGHPHPKYPAQVSEYMQLIQRMYPEAEVEGWLWFVDSGKMYKVNMEGGEI